MSKNLERVEGIKLVHFMGINTTIYKMERKTHWSLANWI